MKRFAILLALLSSICVLYAYVMVDGINYTLNSDGTAIVYQVGYDTKLPADFVIPSELEADGKTYIVTEIGQSAFAGVKELESLVVPVTIKKIGKSAFNGCVNLKTLELRGNGEEIELASGSGILLASGVSLDSFVLGRTFSEGYNPSNGSLDFQQIIVTEGVVALAEKTCGNAGSLHSVTFPSTLKAIGKNCFINDKSITEIYCYAPVPPVTEPDGAYYEFYDCLSVKNCTHSLHVPEGCKQAYVNVDPWSRFDIYDDLTIAGQTISVVLDAHQGGTISCGEVKASSVKETVGIKYDGGGMSFSITPDPGCEFTNFKVLDAEGSPVAYEFAHTAGGVTIRVDEPTEGLIVSAYFAEVESHTLTISATSSGTHHVDVAHGQSYTFAYRTASGQKVDSVTLDGESIPAEGLGTDFVQVSTPPVDSDKTLQINVKGVVTSEASPLAGVSITSMGRTIIIDGAFDAESVKVTTASGIVSTYPINCGTATFTLPAGVNLLTIDGITYKIVI